MQNFLRTGLNYALRLFYVSILIFLTAQEISAAQNIKIEIPETIYIDLNNNDEFTLGDIAKITGGSRENRKALSELVLYTDDGHTLTRDFVLRAINTSEAADARIELFMPTKIFLEEPEFEGNLTETQEPAKNRTLKDLEPFIKNLASWNGEVEISANSQVPDGKIIDPTSIIVGTPGVTLRFRDENGRVKSLPVRLTWYQNIVMASRNINKGDKLTTGNLMTRKQKISKSSSGLYASNFNEVVGFLAEKRFKQGEPITLNSVSSPRILKKGRTVTIIARYNGAKVSTAGILMDDGAVGDWVRVRRADNKKAVMRAKILSENLVEVLVQ